MTSSGSELSEDAGILLFPLALAIDAGNPSLPLAGGPLRFPRMRVSASDADDGLAAGFVEAAAADEWLTGLPDRLRERAKARLESLTAARPALPLAGRQDPLAFARPLVMGVVNVTPDSFSDGGRFADIDDAIAHAHALIKAGADIVDIGGESTRPGAKPVWEEEERRRVIPVIEAIRSEARAISIDSRKAGVMAAALEAGADIINDVSALAYDDDSLRVASESGAPVILMHALGDPAEMQRDPRYSDVLREVFAFLAARISACEAAGIGRERLLVDPGIGFGKTVRHNLELIDGLAAFHGLGVPLVLGVSRKRFIGALSREEQADRRMPGSLGAALAGVDRGAQILRVHDVAEMRQALAVRQGLADIALLRQTSPEPPALTGR